MAVPACFINIGEVQVDDTGDGDEVGDALGALGKDAIGNREGLEHGGLLLGDVEQLIVRNDDHGVDAIGEGLDALLGALLTLAALEGEGLGHDGDGQCADLVHRDIGNDGSSAGTGAAALAAGDKHHVGASERLGDVVAGLIGSLAANLGIGAGAQAAGKVGADVHLDIGIRDRECLSIGVDGNKLDAADALFDHSIDRVGTAAADADHLNDGKVVVDLCLVHVGPPNKGYSHSMGRPLRTLTFRLKVNAKVNRIMFAHYERISQIIDRENQTNQINGVVWPLNKASTSATRSIPKCVVARRAHIDIRYALYLRKQLGDYAFLLGDIVRIAQRHLNAVIEVCRDGFDRRRGNILDLSQELARKTTHIIQAGLNGFGVHRLAGNRSDIRRDISQ